MSELAFDADGEPIEFPIQAEELRVRRFRNPGARGSCEVVHDEEGAPLYVSVDVGFAEFRRQVDAVPGRYRLDPVDGNRRVVAGAVPAYVSIVAAPVRNGNRSVNEEEQSLIRDLVRANVEMTRNVTERFASFMQSAAELVRAADSAGITRREAPPMALPAAPAVDDGDEDEGEEDDDEDDDEEGPDLNALIAQFVPMIQMWLATKGGGGAPAVPVASPVRNQASDASGAGQPAVDGSERGNRSSDFSPSPEQLAHLVDIYGRLTPREQRVTQRVITRLPDVERAAWLEKVMAMCAEEAAAQVRSMVGEPARQTEAAGQATASIQAFPNASNRSES